MELVVGNRVSCRFSWLTGELPGIRTLAATVQKKICFFWVTFPLFLVILLAFTTKLERRPSCSISYSWQKGDLPSLSHAPSHKKNLLKFFHSCCNFVGSLSSDVLRVSGKKLSPRHVIFSSSWLVTWCCFCLGTSFSLLVCCGCSVFLVPSPPPSPPFLFVMWFLLLVSVASQSTELSPSPRAIHAERVSCGWHSMFT